MADNVSTSDEISPIFIVGLPRSGSTLWSNIVAQDKTVMRFGEMHYLHPWHKDFRDFLRADVGDLDRDEAVERLVEQLFCGRSFSGLRGNFWQQIQRVEPQGLKERLYARVIDSDRSLGAIFRALIEEATHIRGYERCLVKFPVYANRVADLMRWWPGAPVVHITRDPRGTAASKMRDPGGTAKRLEQYPALSGLIEACMRMSVVIQYNWTSRVHHQLNGLRDYGLFRYEDLLDRPEETIQALCKFTGMEYAPAMLNPRRGQPSSLTGVARDGFDANSALRWRARLSRREACLIEMLTRNAMGRFGYDPAAHPVSQGKTMGNQS